MTEEEVHRVRYNILNQLYERVSLVTLESTMNGDVSPDDPYVQGIDDVLRLVKRWADIAKEKSEPDA